MATGNVDITGQYQEHEAVPLIRKQRAQLAWLPAVWPETWSYTLTQAWQAGLNVLTFDIGTPAAQRSMFAMELSSNIGSGLSRCTHNAKSTNPIARSP